MIYFVHGNSCSSAVWKPLLKALHLAPSETTTLDLPGHRLNKTGHGIETFTYRAMAEWLAEQFDGQADYSVVAHSMGGHLATQALQLVEKQPSKLVMSGTPPLQMPLNMEEAFVPSPAIGVAFKPELNEEEFAILKEAFWGEAQPYPEFREDVMEVDSQMKLELAQDMAKPDAIAPEAPILEAAHTEVYAINGAQEATINTDYIKRLEGSAFLACHEVEGTRHFPMVEKPAEYASLLQKCLL